MKKRSVILALLTAALAAGGCSIAGTWRTVQVDPEDAAGDGPFARWGVGEHTVERRKLSKQEI